MAARSLPLAVLFGIIISREALAQNAPQGPLVLCQSGNYAVSVTANASTRSRTQYTVSHPDTFRVTNTSVDCGATFLLSHTETPPVVGVTLNKPSVTLNPGAWTTVIATYDVGSPGSGVLTLKAVTQQNSAVWDADYVTVTSVTDAPSNWDVSPFNQDNQDVGRCAAACFAATYAQGTVPYFSLDAPRNATLAYNSDRVWPKPFIHLNVQKPLSSVPDTIFLQVQKGGVWQTFINGDSLLKFLAAPSGWQRIGGQLGDSTWATGMYPVDLVVTWHYPGGSTTVQTWTTKLMVVNEAVSSIARGWIIAGLQRGYPQADSSVLITEGDGSAVFFRKRTATGFFSPTGDFSLLVVNGTGWKRSYPDSTKIFFNSAGRPTDVYDRFNNRTQFLYDGSNRLTTIRDPNSQDLVLAYGTSGLSSIRDNIPPNRYTNVTVPSDSTLTAIQDPDGVSTRFQYDGSRRLWKVINRRGDTTTVGYQTINGKTSGKVGTTTAPAVPIYGEGAVAPVTSLAPWQTVGVPYSSAPVPVVLPDTVYGRVTDPGGHTTRFTVSHWGTAAVATDPLGRTDSTRFDANGMPIRVRSTTGAVDSAVYNEIGLPIYVKSGGVPATRIRYAGWAQADSTWTDDGFTGARDLIGANGRIDSTRSWGAAGASVTRFRYDTRGRVDSVVDPLGHLTARTWYAATNGNRSKDSLPGGRVTTYTYDAYGRLTAVLAPGVATHGTAFDVLNRITRDSAAGFVTTYAYDSLYLRSVTDPRTQVYGFKYNALGWITARADPTGRADTLLYDRDGLLRSWKNRRLETLRYFYDSGHRLTGEGGTNTDSTRFTYTPDGRVASDSGAWAVDSQFFSTEGRVDSLRTRLGGQVFTQRFRYTIRGQLDSVAIAGGGITFLTRKYKWQPQSGALDTIRLGGGGSTGLVPNADGLLTTTVFPGGDGQTRAFTSVHDEATIATTAPYAQTVSRYLGFDIAQRITRQVMGDGLTGRGFTYDSLGRLASDSAISWVDTSNGGGDNPCTGDPPPDVDENGNLCTYPTYGGYWLADSGRVFTYDAVGNRTDQGGNYGSANRIRAFGGCTFVTDSLGDGNVLSRTCGTETVRFYWTAESRLKAVKIVGGDSIDFRYEAAGRLVRKDVNGSASAYFLWQGENVLAELNATATGKVTEYSYYLGFDNPHAVITGTTASFAHLDAIGNVIALTDSAQTVQRSYEYGEWGALIGGSDAKPFNNTDRVRFKGALWMGPEVDVYYMRARWYEPKSGRFLSEDPVGINGGINPFTYAGNDPVNRRDPTGLCAEDEELWVRYQYHLDERGNQVVDGILGYFCVKSMGVGEGGGGSGGAGSAGEATRRVKPDECPPPPIAPPVANLNANIMLAKEHREYAVDWFQSMVDYGHPWDYKTQGTPGQYEAFGNFNYGATGRAAMIAPDVLYRAAGYAQLRHNHASRWDAYKKAFWGPYPYGDDPRDQANIRAGQQYYENRCYGGPTP